MDDWIYGFLWDPHEYTNATMIVVAAVAYWAGSRFERRRKK